MGDDRRVSNAVRERFDAALRDFIGPATAEMRAIGADLGPVADAASEFVLDGGKRLRPSFCFWGALAAGGEDSEALVHAAASLELLQACALIHDDLIDNSDTRRGRPAVHQRFADLHRRSDWSGAPADFGAAAAILIGDLLLAWSDTMLANSGLHDGALRRTRPISSAMRTEVMVGQYLDVLEQARGETTVDRALRVARLKSAKYTVERPLHLGAAIAKAGDDITQAYSKYGIPLGEAFQLRDDLLGVFGEPATTGKPAGDDLREGKQTVLIALTLSRGSLSDREFLRGVLGQADLSTDDVERARGVITASGAAAEVEEMIATRLDEALAALNEVGLERGAQRELVLLAGAASYRHE